MTGAGAGVARVAVLGWCGVVGCPYCVAAEVACNMKCWKCFQACLAAARLAAGNAGDDSDISALLPDLPTSELSECL